MSGPLDDVIGLLSDASTTRERTRATVAESWSDVVFRTLDQRALSQLEVESRLALSALNHANETFREAIRLLEE